MRELNGQDVAPAGVDRVSLKFGFMSALMCAILSAQFLTLVQPLPADV